MIDINMMTLNKGDVTICSVCKKDSNEVKKILVGHDSAICNECVMRFIDALINRDDTNNKSTNVSMATDKNVCILCGSEVQTIKQMIVHPRFTVCSSCLILCVESLIEKPTPKNKLLIIDK